MSGEGRLLYVVVCGAGPAEDVGELVAMAQAEGWTVQIVTTPAALDFINVPDLEEQTGRPVRSHYRKPDEPKPPRADAIIVAPATYNTINKFAHGAADTYALGVLAEAPGLGIPVVMLPFVNNALASRLPFGRSVEQLRSEGVRILLQTGEPIDTFPWHLALNELAGVRLW
jgi:phosphopantothenoylcysteine synthetase/decarboxylase